MLGSRVEQCGPQVRVGRIAPWTWLDPADRREPATPATAMVEGEAQADRVEPGPDVGAVEPVPRPEGRQVRVLGDVLGIVRVAEDQHQASDERRVVRPDRRLERLRLPVRRGGAIPSRRRRRVRGGHGIGDPKQSPTPVAPTRWSATMITVPSASSEPGITWPCSGGVD